MDRRRHIVLAIIIAVILLMTTLSILSACGPSHAELEYQEKLREYEEAQRNAELEHQEKLREYEEAQRNAELEYQEKLREYEEAQQQAQEREKLEEIRNWCIELAVIIENDKKIIDSWNEFRHDSANITPFSSTDSKNKQEEEFLRHMELFETLNTQLINLDIPYECQEANRVLRNYLQKRGSAIMDLIIYYASGQGYYRLTYNEKLVEINGLHQQYINEFQKVVNEWNLWGDVSPYLSVPEH